MTVAIDEDRLDETFAALANVQRGQRSWPVFRMVNATVNELAAVV